jgi:hypothetical protein
MMTIVLSRVPPQYGYASLPARLPHSGRIVRTGRDYPLPIAAEHGAVDLSRVPLQYGYNLACACLPHPRRLVITRRDYPLPIGAEYHTVYPLSVPAQFGYSFACACLPHPHGRVSTRCNHPRLLLDSRVVDVSRAYTPTLVMLSSLKPLFFNSLSNELHFSDNAGA